MPKSTVMVDEQDIDVRGKTVAELMEEDPRLFYDLIMSDLREASERESASMDIVARFLLLAHDGGLIIVFTPASVVFRSGRTFVPRLAPAIVFAFGPGGTGFSVLKNLTAAKYWRDWSVRRANDALYGGDWPSFDTAWRDRQDALVQRRPAGRLVLFAFGVFVGFFVLRPIQDSLSRSLS